MGAGALRRKYAPQKNKEPEDANSQWRKPRSKEEIHKARQSGILNKSTVENPRRASTGDDDATDLADAVNKIWSKLLMEEGNSAASVDTSRAGSKLSVDEQQENLEGKLQKLEQAQQLLRGAHGRYHSAQVEYKAALDRASSEPCDNWAVGDIAVRKGDVCYVVSSNVEDDTVFLEVRAWNSTEVVGTTASKLFAPSKDDAAVLRRTVDALKQSKEEMKSAEQAAMKAETELNAAHERLRKVLHLPQDRMVPPPPMFKRGSNVDVRRSSNTLAPPQKGGPPPVPGAPTVGEGKKAMPDMALMKKWAGTLEADKEKPEKIPYPEVHGIRERIGGNTERLGASIGASAAAKANPGGGSERLGASLGAAAAASMGFPGAKNPTPRDSSKAKPVNPGDGPAGFPSMQKMKESRDDDQRRASAASAAASSAASYPSAHVQREDLGRPRSKDPTPKQKEEVWRSVLHQDGQTYYVNMETNESSWELPPNARLYEEPRSRRESKTVIEEDDDDPFAHLRRHAQEQEDHAKQWNAWYAEYNKFMHEERQRQSSQQNAQSEQQKQQSDNRKQQSDNRQQKAPSHAAMPEIKKDFEDRATFALKTAIQQEMSLMIKKPQAERKKALRTLQLQWHPDKNPDKEEIAKKIFQFIEESKDWFLAA